MHLVLETKRLVLRPYRTVDGPAIRSLANNWKVASRLGRMPFPYEPGMAEAFMADHDAQRKARTAFPFAVTLENRLIGGIGLDHNGPAEWELGYWLGEPFWERGYATEAGRAAIDFGFTLLALKRIAAGHFVDNPASGRVLRKLGFRYTGKAFRQCLARGQAVESLEMALDRDDWTGP